MRKDAANLGKIFGVFLPPGAAWHILEEKGKKISGFSAEIVHPFQPIPFVESSLSHVIPTEVPIKYREPRSMNWHVL
jgi:hypothetical protein